MDSRVRWNKLDAYLVEEASAEDVAQVSRWMKSEPDATAGLAALKRSGSASDAPDPAAWDVEAALTRVKHRPDSQPVAGVGRGLRFPWDGRQKNRTKSATGHTRRLALSSIGLAAAAALIFAVAPQLQRSIRDSFAAPDRTLVTLAGQRSSVTLGDGTRVILGPASRLQYSSTLVTASGPREVELSGEAYFRVMHRAERPFRIVAGRTVTEVLGTSFSVRAYDNDESVQIAVIEGRVSFEAATPRSGAKRVPPRQAILRGGDVARVVSDSFTITRSGDLSAHTAWIEGRLVLERVSLSDAARQLARWYDVDIEIADRSIADRRVTASFARQRLPDILSALCEAVGARFEQRGRLVIISPAVSR
ncbi:MAG: FecR domain-containing protein [Gemmatimonadaceae bacterium]